MTFKKIQILKKRKHVLIACLLFFCLGTYGQRIIFQEDFEVHNNPVGYLAGQNDLENATSGRWYSSNICTPDIISELNGPYIAGDQRVLQSHSESSSLGIIFNKNNKARTDGRPDRLWSEIAQTRLHEPLKKGKKYYVEFWVSSNCGYEILDGFGIYFCADSVKYDSITDFREKVRPHIYSNCRLTKKWKKVSKIFQPESDLEYLTIGYFDHSKLGITDFYFTIDDILIQELEPNKPLDRNLEDYCFEEGQQIPLDNIEFDTDEAILREVSFSELKILTKILKSNPTLIIQIEGHTDNEGEEQHNQALSENRAKSVYNFLIQNDIPSSRMTWKGFGESKPIETNDTEQGRQSNRRVVINITKRISPETIYLSACRNAKNNQLDSAFYYLKSALALGIDDLVVLFDPDLENLKKDARWKGIIGWLKNKFLAKNITIGMERDLVFQLQLIFLEDQIIRDNTCSRFKHLKGKNYPCNSEAINLIFEKNAIELNLKHRQIINRHFGSGDWPSLYKIGRQGFLTIFLVVQHSGDLEYMRRYLPKFEESAKWNKSLLKDIAYMKDRIRVLQDLPQIYGTQFLHDMKGYYPIEDIENVNSRREPMGLHPIKIKPKK